MRHLLYALRMYDVLQDQYAAPHKLPQTPAAAAHRDLEAELLLMIACSMLHSVMTDPLRNPGFLHDCNCALVSCNHATASWRCLTAALGSSIGSTAGSSSSYSSGGFAMPLQQQQQQFAAMIASALPQMFALHDLLSEEERGWDPLACLTANTGLAVVTSKFVAVAASLQATTAGAANPAMAVLQGFAAETLEMLEGCLRHAATLLCHKKGVGQHNTAAQDLVVRAVEAVGELGLTSQQVGAEPALFAFIGSIQDGLVRKQVFSLLSTLLKLAAPKPMPSGAFQAACWGVLNTALALLPAVAANGAQDGADAVTQGAVPSLALFGRSLLQLARQMLQHPGLFNIMFSLGLGPVSPVIAVGDGAVTHTLSFQARLLMHWLCSEPYTTALNTAGYAVGDLVQHLEALLDADDAACNGAVTLEAFVQQMEAAGSAFAAMAVRTFCNNPHCPNLSGASETALTACLKCGQCRAAFYCSKECQRSHWKQHKPVCSSMSAAAAAAAAAGEGL